MKKIEECLDLVLQTLIDNGDGICIFQTDNATTHLGKKFDSYPPYATLFKELNLKDNEAIQLLKILHNKAYVIYDLVSGVAHSNVYVKLKSDNSIASTPFEGFGMNDWVGKPNKIEITLEGKFFIREGGYTGKYKKEEAKELTQKIVQWVTVVGAAISGLYLLTKALIWFCSNFCF